LALDRKLIKSPKLLQNTIIRTFDQLPKNNLQILAVDQKFKITQNDINKTFNQVKIINNSFDQLPKFVKY
jgi:hypothetical protein